MLVRLYIKDFAIVDELERKYNQTIRLRYLKRSLEFLAQRLQMEVGLAQTRGKIVIEQKTQICQF